MGLVKSLFFSMNKIGRYVLNEPKSYWNWANLFFECYSIITVHS